jgi:TetR/AcrR family transcriptional repressor of nem operon
MRPKQFDPNKVLDKAMLTFWLQGYEATSMQDLVDAMNIQRQSLYNVFENKRALYLDALKYYQKTVIEPNFASLSTDPSPLKAIKIYFNQRIKDVDDPNVINGCFVTNSVSELGLLDDEIRAQIRLTIDFMENTFFAAIKRAQDLGEIDASKNAKLLATVLLNNAQGLFVLGKSGMSTRKLKTVVRQLMAVLQ